MRMATGHQIVIIMYSTLQEEAVMNHHKRLRLRDWLEMRIGNPRYPGLEWVDERRKIFRIPWKHGARHGWKENEDARIFREWSEHTGACPRDTKQHKANFRCALNSLKDVKKIPFLSKRKGDDAYRVYQLQLGNNKNNKNPNRWIRKRVSRHNRMTSSSTTTSSAKHRHHQQQQPPITQTPPPPPYTVTSSSIPLHYVIGESSCDSWNDAVTSHSAPDVSSDVGVATGNSGDFLHFPSDDDIAYHQPHHPTYNSPYVIPSDVTINTYTGCQTEELMSSSGYYMTTGGSGSTYDGGDNYYYPPAMTYSDDTVVGYHEDYYQPTTNATPIDHDVTISAAMETASATVYSYDFPGAAVVSKQPMTSSPSTSSHWMMEEEDDKNDIYHHYQYEEVGGGGYPIPTNSQNLRLPSADTLLCLNSATQW